MSSFRGRRWDRRYVVRAAVVICFAAAFAGWLAIYVRDSVRASNDMRARAEMMRNMQVAQLYASHLDRDCDTALRTLDMIAQRPEVVDTVNGGVRHGALALTQILLAGAPSVT